LIQGRRKNAGNLEELTSTKNCFNAPPVILCRFALANLLSKQKHPETLDNLAKAAKIYLELYEWLYNTDQGNDKYKYKSEEYKDNEDKEDREIKDEENITKEDQGNVNNNRSEVKSNFQWDSLLKLDDNDTFKLTADILTTNFYCTKALFDHWVYCFGQRNEQFDTKRKDIFLKEKEYINLNRPEQLKKYARPRRLTIQECQEVKRLMVKVPLGYLYTDVHELINYHEKIKHRIWLRNSVEKAKLELELAKQDKVLVDKGGTGDCQFLCIARQLQKQKHPCIGRAFRFRQRRWELGAARELRSIAVETMNNNLALFAVMPTICFH